jgi:hypothetical protein
MRWLRDLTWKQRFAEKAARCDDLEAQLSRFNRRRSELERNEQLAQIAERIFNQRRSKTDETGGPMVKCERCAELAFGSPANLCGYCELDAHFEERAKKKNAA